MRSGNVNQIELHKPAKDAKDANLKKSLKVNPAELINASGAPKTDTVERFSSHMRLKKQILQAKMEQGLK